MNSFKLYLDGNEIKNTVFPFRFGELLDERLDEAYVDFYGSDVEAFTPTTEAKVEIYQDDKKVDTQYYIVANDNSQEYPIGSGKYKHSIYLLERTKLLDGVICSSLTFTNTLPKDYSKIVHRVYAEVTAAAGGDNTSIVNFRHGIECINSPISTTQELTLPSVKELGEEIVSIIKNDHDTGGYQYEYLPIAPPAMPGEDKRVSHYAVYDPNNDIYIIEPGAKNQGETLDASKLKGAKTIQVIYCIYYNRKHQTFGERAHAAMVIFYVDIVENLMMSKKWTITDCVNRVLECAKPLFQEETPEFRFEGVDYNGINEYTGQAAIYDKILAPEFSLSPGTLREQLKVIGSFIHAEPYLDGGNVVRFKSLGETTKSGLTDSPYVYSAAKTDINQYCTDIISNAQNLVCSIDDSLGATTTPNRVNYRSVRTEEIYSRITKENAVASTEYPIHSILKVSCGIRENDGNNYINPVDITPYVFEATEYNSNLSSQDGGYPYSKVFAIYYTIGEKGIKGLFYQAPHAMSADKYSEYSICNILGETNTQGYTGADIYDYMVKNNLIANLIFRITYKPIYSVYISHGKHLLPTGTTHIYSQMYNQSENLVESQYFGENIKGVAARLGNTEEERTYILRSWEDIPNAGQTLDKYAISAVNTEIMPNHIKCTLGLSKDFNRISEYVGVSSIKRMYEISERSVYDRNILIREYLVIGTKSDNQNISGQNITGFRDIFPNDSSSGAEFIIDEVAVLGRYKSGNPIEKTLLLPVMKSQLGNVLSFCFSYYDNFSAGHSTFDSTITEEDKNISGKWLSDVKYTDKNGKIFWLDFCFGRAIGSGTTACFDYPDVQPDLNFTELISPPGHLRLRKDNRERVSITYQIEAKTNDKNIIVYSEFMKLCKYLQSDAQDLYLVQFSAKYPFNKFDSNYYQRVGDSSTKIKSYWIHGVDTDDGFSFAPRKAEFELSEPYHNLGYGWAIVTSGKTEQFEVVDDEGTPTMQTIETYGKILIASTSTGTEEIKLDFFMTRD